MKTTTVRLGIAKAGTRVLNFAIPKAEGGGAYEHDDGEARFGKFDDEGWRILQNDDSGQKQASVLNFAILKVEGGRTMAMRLGFAKVSTWVLDFTNPKVADGLACQNEGEMACICKSERGVGWACRNEGRVAQYC